MQIGNFDHPMSAPQMSRSLEAYVLWLLGKVMFTESHGSTVSRRFIPIAQEIADATAPADIRRRSWGSALLAGTYRAMCNACTLTTPGSALLGCPLFLQLWSWERFPIGRPNLARGFIYGIHEMNDADDIDMPTCGTLWTRREVRIVD